MATPALVDIEASAGDAEAPGYAIGTVANLTGLDPHTIRAWERRHGAVEPQRSPSGMRRYGEADVTRLQLLKTLTDCGESIGAVATLDDAALRDRLDRLAGMGPGPEAARRAGPLSVALLAPLLEAQAGSGGDGLFDVRARAADRAALLAALAEGPVDAVVVELRALGSEPLRALRRIQSAARAALVVVLYDFAPESELARLANAGARLLRGPLRTARLVRALADFLAMDAAALRAEPRTRARLPADLEARSRIFDDAQLARLLEMPGAVACECPSHLATLLTSLVGFERYSRDCESRSPGDAALHRRLAGSTSRVRADLERILLDVCEHEGIRLREG